LRDDLRELARVIDESFAGGLSERFLTVTMPKGLTVLGSASGKRLKKAVIIVRKCSINSCSAETM
jgi:hypothetical protein